MPARRARGPRCLVFADGDDWIVFAPRTLLAMRTNARAAERFRALSDGGPAAPAVAPADNWGDGFPPAHVTISCTSMCAQRCVYCYGTPAHRNRAVLDADFCRVALDLVGERAAVLGQPVRAIFHGVGEPTMVWQRFCECVEIVREAGHRFGVPVDLDLCTGGQVDDDQAAWVAHRFDSVQVSIDGPPDVQNRQRPRADGRDSLERPLALARAVKAAGRRLCVKTTVTDATLSRVVEIVEFVAREIGRVRLDLGMMVALPWVSSARAHPPAWERFVAEFGRALDRGAELGVQVRHPTVSWETLLGARARVSSHFCLAAPDVVTSFFDVPREHAGKPELGAYGWYDATRRTIVFEHDKRRRLEEGQAAPECQECACGSACLGQGGVKGRLPQGVPVLGPVCQARLGVLKEMLRRAVPRREQAQEVAS
jgi:sulfatase maturation enzyme AslB (radical SAM superfamily)